MALATILEQHVDLQFGGRVEWSYTAATIEADAMSADQGRARAMYSRLARQYDARPAVHGTGGGVPGDLIPL